jgi:hypothetical protein
MVDATGLSVHLLDLDIISENIEKQAFEAFNDR